MTRSRTHGGPGPTASLLAVLLLMLALSAVLAYQAWDAARSHRRVTEAALRDYASFASWELRRRVESSASATLTAALLPTRLPLLALDGPALEPAAELERFAAIVQLGLTQCACPGAVTRFFLLDLAEEAPLVRTLGTEGVLRDWLGSDFLAEVRRTAGTAGEPGLRIESRPGGSLVIRQLVQPTPSALLTVPVPFDSSLVAVYTPGPARDGGRRVYGFVVAVPAFLAPLAAGVVAGAPLLPPSLTGLASNAEVLSLTLWPPGGDPVHRAGGGFTPGTEVTDTIDAAVGTLLARVAVRPEVAARLVIGGLPRSRVPLLLGAVGLTLALILIALVQLRRQQELFRLRADFVAGVSHELRTPLAQIRLFSDLLASERLEEGQRRRSIRILGEEAQRLTYLVENVLRFSRSERTADRISPVPLEVAPLLREIVDGFLPLARSREARLTVVAPAGLRAPLDADAVRQVLLNLLDNAAKYGPRGQRVEVSAAEEDGWLRIRVDDEGPGIPEPERDRIWEPYRRLAREVEAATGGSGIGLAVVRELVELHGGRAFAADRPGGGSRFVLRLPGAAATDLPAAAAPASAAGPREAGV
jgi:signal transduction histidine kinase